MIARHMPGIFIPRWVQPSLVLVDFLLFSKAAVKPPQQIESHTGRDTQITAQTDATALCFCHTTQGRLRLYHCSRFYPPTNVQRSGEPKTMGSAVLEESCTVDAALSRKYDSASTAYHACGVMYGAECSFGCKIGIIISTM